MAKPMIDEVEVLRFFETESIDKVSVMYKIVADKMRGRLQADPINPLPTEPSQRRARKTQLPNAHALEPTPGENSGH
jgi:hypothetical protein